jgi:hypothetical protein
MPCSMLNVNRRFGEIYSFHLQVRKANLTVHQRESSWQVDSLCVRRLHILPEVQLTMAGLHGGMTPEGGNLHIMLVLKNSVPVE